MSQTQRQYIGRIGEDAVASRYAEMGFWVVARNLHVSRNEIDLILQSNTHLVFVEVKTRHAEVGIRGRFGRPADAVNAAKRARTLEAVQTYLRAHPTALQPRIDIAEVYMRRTVDVDGRATERITDVKIFPNAFSGR